MLSPLGGLAGTTSSDGFSANRAGVVPGQPLLAAFLVKSVLAGQELYVFVELIHFLADGALVLFFVGGNGHFLQLVDLVLRGWLGAIVVWIIPQEFLNQCVHVDASQHRVYMSDNLIGSGDELVGKCDNLLGCFERIVLREAMAELHRDLLGQTGQRRQQLVLVRHLLRLAIIHHELVRFVGWVQFFARALAARTERVLLLASPLESGKAASANVAPKCLGTSFAVRSWLGVRSARSSVLAIVIGHVLRWSEVGRCWLWVGNAGFDDQIDFLISVLLNSLLYWKK